MKNLFKSVSAAENSAKFLHKGEALDYNDEFHDPISEQIRETESLKDGTKNTLKEMKKGVEQEIQEPLTPKQVIRCRNIHDEYLDHVSYWDWGYFIVDKGIIKFASRTRKDFRMRRKRGMRSGYREFPQITNKILGDISMEQFVRYVNEEHYWIPAEYDTEEFWKLRRKHYLHIGTVKRFENYPKIRKKIQVKFIYGWGGCNTLDYVIYCVKYKEIFGEKEYMEEVFTALEMVARKNPYEYLDRHNSFIRIVGEKEYMKHAHPILERMSRGHPKDYLREHIICIKIFGKEEYMKYANEIIYDIAKNGQTIFIQEIDHIYRIIPIGEIRSLFRKHEASFNKYINFNTLQNFKKRWILN